MIIRAMNGSLYLITQPDHAALARRIMERWLDRGLAGHPRRPEILLATEEHDNGWREPDGRPLRDPESGRLLDFITVPASVRQGVWPRAIARHQHQPWIAALIAQHALSVYSRFRDDAVWDAFFRDVGALRDGYLLASARSAEMLNADYFFVRMGDLISLTFCNGWIETQRHDGYAIRLDGPEVRIAPDPFGGQRVAFDITARVLPDRSFASDLDAETAFAAAPHVTLSGTAAGMI